MNNKSPHTIAPGLIRAHGGYRDLKSFQHAELVYEDNQIDSAAGLVRGR